MAAPTTLRIADREFKVEVTPAGVAVDGVAASPAAKAVTVADGDRRLVFLDGEVFEFEVQRQGRRGGSGHHSSLTAPMPATVIRINVAPGAAVKKGDTLLVLEAMKMELPVRAPADGTVASIACAEGQLVQPGVPLVELDD
jgi:biotin carboxyl carrier protein